MLWGVQSIISFLEQGRENAETAGRFKSIQSQNLTLHGNQHPSLTTVHLRMQVKGWGAILAATVFSTNAFQGKVANTQRSNI